MNSKRVYLLLSGTITLLIVLMIAGTYGTNKLLSSRAARLTNLKATSQALSQQQASLAGTKKEIAKYTGLEKIAQTIVPADKSQAEAVLQIVNIAQSNSVSLSSITFPSSTLGTSTTNALATTPSPAAIANSPQTKLSQLTPVKNIPGVYTLPITVQSDTTQPISYNQFLNFLSGLEHNRRTAQVVNINLNPSLTVPGKVSFTIVLNEYIKP